MSSFEYGILEKLLKQRSHLGSQIAFLLNRQIIEYDLRFLLGLYELFPQPASVDWGLASAVADTCYTYDLVSAQPSSISLEPVVASKDDFECMNGHDFISKFRHVLFLHYDCCHYGCWDL